MHDKIISLSELTTQGKLAKTAKKSVGCLSGSFDLISARHFKSLRSAKERCDVLVILLNSDASVRAYKGAGKPLLHQDERAYVLAQSPAVDYVVLFDELTPLKALQAFRPDVFFNQSEWGQDCIEKYTVEAYGGRLEIFDIEIPTTWCKSTSVIIDRITSAAVNLTQRAIFLDRDGVINENKEGYLHLYEDITYMPHLISSLKAFAAAGYKLIIVTNQSGIARGYYTKAQMETLHEQMCNYFKEAGVIVDAVYHCPHGPDDGCVCRKPGIGLFLKAAEEHNLNLSKSWFIGDSSSDIVAGRHANVRTVYIGEEETYPVNVVRPNYFVPSLEEAAKRILT